MKLDKNKKYIIGVSGGPDSMYLLEFLKKEQIKNVIVCHVNYHYRKESNYDQKIVEDYCAINDLKLKVLNVDQDYKKLNSNFESWAREVRYNFFLKIAKENNFENLLLGHNLNDSIETFIMQKQRNNLVSFFGIKKISKNKILDVYRPLLNVKKSEILKFLNENKIKYALDDTNNDEKYKRNKIRKSLNENDFELIVNEINFKNLELNKIMNKVDSFIKSNIDKESLNLNQNLQTSELDFIQRCIFEWLKRIKKDFLIYNRSNKTLNEIAKKIKLSNKAFWEIQIENFIIFKDYNKLKIINKNLKTKKTVKINSEEDFKKIIFFINYKEIVGVIKRDGLLFPYVVTNDYNYYKTRTKVGNKKTNRFFIDKKINNYNRIAKAVVFSTKDYKILNKIK
ncbi:tRNA(Ile)-lysidine synthase [Entomoplasma ellychniae]|uniref:tRNA(Ile)-lysidine synthase n=1 Tax=Entomoplasma ellychniae TaxID=2114 RepID=A0A8E2UE66_9MOLU|nr:tRNA lysidine(34) synthetase TilS [Entomoplasma ellychniae]PPE04788.1 tRNA(Ile)-lysidine synthase [Entomoplasma ellychniae]